MASSLDETDFLILIALSLGLSQEDAGVFATSEEKPSGISGRTVRARWKAKAEVFDRLLARAKTAIRKDREAACQAVRDLSPVEYEKAMKGERGIRHEVKRLALQAALMNPEDPDLLKVGLQAASQMDDRDFGKPKQRIEQTVTGAIYVFNPQPVKQLARQEIELIDSSEFVQKYLPPGVIEAEVVNEEA